ncbi:MAG: fasciclin domain-containing protein [Bacteroidota bacterium]
MKNYLLLCLLLLSGSVFAQIELPIDFESTTIDYDLTDFAGNASMIVVDPTDPGNMVAMAVKSDSAALFAGTTMGDDGLASAIPFANGSTVMTVRVWSPDAGIQVRLKAETAGTPQISVETEATTTVAQTWETLEFDFTNEAMNTAAINFANTYDKITIFFNFGVTGAMAGEKTYFWDDVTFVPGTPKPDLPITFEDASIDYDLTDFAGNASMIVVDPTDPSNMVATAVKSDSAALFAGTTMGDDGLANPIPFGPGATVMTVRVWSPDAGIPVRLKAETAGSPQISVETEAMTTVAQTWETLEFDFTNEAMNTSAIDFANTYDKISIFFNFGTTGDVAGEKTYFWDDVAFAPADPKPDLPITFEDPSVDYDLTDFAGNASMIVVDPTDPQNMVGMAVKSDSAALFAGTTMGDDGLLNPVPFAPNATKMTVRVWSPDAGIQVRLKAETVGSPQISVETEATTTVAQAWETLEFDFLNEAMNTAAIDFANTYDKITIFFNFGVTGAMAGEKTYFWDDVAFVAPPPLDQVDLPITFEDANVDYDLTDFGGNASSIVVDPTDPGNMVGQAIRNDMAEVFAGTTMGDDGLINPVPFAPGVTSMRVRVWAPDAGIPVRLKVENTMNGGIAVETEATTTVAQTWETLEFNFSNPAPNTSALDFNNTYDKVSIFFNFGTSGMMAGEQTYYWDDVEFIPGTPLEQIDLPITFEDSNVDYNLTDFAGNASSIVEDPTDPSNTVGQAIKTTGADTFAGTTMGNSGLANPVPFAEGMTRMTVRVWSPDAGIPVRLKVENLGNAGISVETEASTTVAQTWETLEFDFTNEAMGTTPIDFNNVYNKITIFFNFGTTGAMAGEKTYFWDDVAFVMPPPLDPVDLPITFEDANVDYDLTDFAGNASSIVEDPTDPTNMVGQAIKTDVADVFAGTTMGDDGLANPIPFAMGATKMKVRVWSPDAGTPIRLKAEDAGNGMISVETEDTTSVAGGWELLEFDFANPAPNTAAIDFNNTYDKLSIFFNFGTTGMAAGEKTYFWDDVQFGGIVTVFGVIADRPEHVSVVGTMETFGLDDLLNGPGPLTLFAPLDAAFDSLSPAEQAVIFANGFPVLSYHVLGQELPSSMISNGQMVTTLQGEDITITVNGSDVILNNDARVVEADIIADNGIVHIIDNILVPPTLVSVRDLDQTEIGIEVAPNPAVDVFQISFPEPLRDEARVSLLGLDGTLLQQTVVSDQTASLPVDQVQSGIYILRIDLPQGSFSKKVMVIR